MINMLLVIIVFTFREEMNVDLAIDLAVDKCSNVDILFQTVTSTHEN